MKKLFYFSMVFCLMALISCGDDKDDKNGNQPTVTTGNIHGLVTDYANANTPIAGATVTLNLKGLSKTTGSDGRFEFTNIEPGTYTIQVMAYNYQTTTKQVTVYANQYANCDFQLSESAVSINPMTLSFGKEVSTMSFTIKNNTTNQQSYKITNIPSYLTLSSKEGYIAAKGNELIVVDVNNRPTKNQNTQIKVTVGNQSVPINVFVQGTDDTNNNGSGGGSNEGSGSASTGDVTRGLLGYFTFDDGTAKNTKDASNNGTLYGTKSSYITDTPNGKGKALSLANKEYINIPSNAVEGNTAFSISMWVKDFGIGALFVSTFLDDTFNGSPRLFIDSNNYFCADGTEEIYDTHMRFGLAANDYQSGRWHMVAATFANKTICLYVDGSLVGKATHDSRTKGHGNKTCIGGMANGIMNNPMKVDNVRIYGVVLTDAEVQSLYNYELQ